MNSITKTPKTTTAVPTALLARIAQMIRRAPKHTHNLVEVALTDDCDYGCKILACECGERVVSHRRIYGCPQG